MPKIKKLGLQSREATFDNVVDEEQRIISVSFASEEPYERWWGIETLKLDGMDVTRAEAGLMPFLVNHQTADQVGLVEKVWRDDDKARAHIKFGNSERALEIWDDIAISKIRRGISVGYVVDEMVLAKKTDDGPDEYDITKFSVLEISSATIPADITVGSEKSAQISQRCAEHETTIKTKEIDMSKPEEKVETRTEAPAVDVAGLKKEISESVAATVLESSRAQIVKDREAEAARKKDIKAMCKRHIEVGKLDREFMHKHIDEGTSLDEFRGLLLEKIANVEPVETPDAKLDMGKKDLQKYSLLRAIVASSKNDWRGAEFERECHEAVEDKLKRQAQGFFVPYDVLVDERDLRGAIQLQRDLSVGTDSAGGYTVDTTLMVGSFIDMLRNKMMIRQLGAIVLAGLVGDLSIPKQTGGATGYWLSEGADATESQQTFGQVVLTPKTAAGYTELTRKLLQQSSMDVENFVRMDLATTLALTLDLAAITGTGSNDQPTGIMNQTGVGLVAMGTNGATPTWDSIVDLETEVAVDNADVGSMAYLTNTKVRGSMKKTPVVSGYPKFLWEKGSRPGFGELNGYPAAVTNQVPSNLTKGSSDSVCSAAIFGCFSQLIIGLWGGLDLLSDPFTKSASGGLRVTAFQDCDIAVRHPESFAVVKDYLTS